MNRCQRAILAPLLAVLVLLLGLAGAASAAFNHAATEPHYGNFLLRESEASASEWLQLADPIKENGEWIYDGALGVPVYVAQNPWTHFDPEGLFMQAVGNWLGERWQAPQAVRSMANHTGTVVNVTQGTLAVASMVPVAGKIADGLSAGISAAEGNYGEAALTAGGGSAGKLLARAKGIMNVADAGADVSKIIREGGEQIQKNADAITATARETTEKTGKEVAQIVKNAKQGKAAKNTPLRQTTVLGENMRDRVIPFADATNARTLPWGTTPERWAQMTPQQRWKLNDGALRARINEGDSFRYIGIDPGRPVAERLRFDLTRSELLRLNDRGIPYQTVTPREVISTIGRP